MSSSLTLDNNSSSQTLRQRREKPEQLFVPSGNLTLQMAWRDVEVLFRTPWIIISRGLAFTIQLFVFATLINGLVRVPSTDLQGAPNFFDYYAVGSIISMVASISFVIGYDIFEEAEEGVLDYLLTLPVSRRQFIVGRALGGAIRTMIYVTPMFAIVAILEQFQQPTSLLSSMGYLFLLAFGVTGLSITVAVSVRSANRFDVFLALLELAVVRASTALYPQAFLPDYVARLAPYSPVSFASNGARDLLFPNPFDLVNLAGLVAFVVVFLGLGAAFYFRKLEGGVYA